jgi:molecular chaperone GrpE
LFLKLNLERNNKLIEIYYLHVANSLHHYNQIVQYYCHHLLTLILDFEYLASIQLNVFLPFLIIDDTFKEIEIVRQNRSVEENELKILEAEYGPEIVRIKKEFFRIKERSYEETAEISSKAKIDALKEVLPITDNFFRAKNLFLPLQTDNEKLIMDKYEEIFDSFSKVIADFGVTRVVSLGQPFDFNMMEAIMTLPSSEYAKDSVCNEYQIGYRVGDRCIRPAMVVVSLGPCPN